MSPEQEAYLDKLVREKSREFANFTAYRLVMVLSCMRAYRIPLPAWCRGVMR